MKILLLGNVNSVHTQRWAIGLADSSIKVFLFSLSAIDNTYPFKDMENIQFYSFGFDEKFTKDDNTGFSKWQYLKVLPTLKQKIKEFNPDILHAHYISGYGTLGALSGFQPFVVSVWGSDIFDFPHKSFLHKILIKFNLKRASKILSTSHVMAKETRLYTNKEIKVTPFGIDMQQFQPEYTKEELFDKDDIVIGTIKTLEEQYGIEYLLKAFKILYDKYPQLPLKLLIVGKGSLEEELKDLSKKLGINEETIFTGNIAFNQVPKYHNMLSVSVSVSNSESFGVAIIEASSCAKPVVVSNVGGLPEVVEDGVSGFIVAPRNPQETADAIERFILDPTLRNTIGLNGRERVKILYNWDNNVKQMIDIYKDILK